MKIGLVVLIGIFIHIVIILTRIVIAPRVMDSLRTVHYYLSALLRQTIVLSSRSEYNIHMEQTIIFSVCAKGVLYSTISKSIRPIKEV